MQVTVEESAAEIKPGMTAEVTFLGPETEGEVLCIPVEAVMGPVKRVTSWPNKNRRQQRKQRLCSLCFLLLVTRGTQEREVAIGLNNETDVEIRSGLEVGERVVLNPAGNSLAE